MNNARRYFAGQALRALVPFNSADDAARLSWKYAAAMVALEPAEALPETASRDTTTRDTIAANTARQITELQNANRDLLKTEAKLRAQLAEARREPPMPADDVEGYFLNDQATGGADLWTIDGELVATLYDKEKAHAIAAAMNAALSASLLPCDCCTPAANVSVRIVEDAPPALHDAAKEFADRRAAALRPAATQALHDLAARYGALGLTPTGPAE